MEGKQNEHDDGDASCTQEQGDNEERLLIDVDGEELVSGDSEEDEGKGNKLPNTQPIVTGDSGSVSSESSGNERRRPPQINCPEHIILCLDLSPETKSMSFQCKSVPERSIFQLVQRSAAIFVKTKSKMNPHHQFSIMVIDDKASWYKHFTSDVEVICSTLNRLSPEDTILSQNGFDMCDLFEAIKESISLPEVEDILLPPPCVFRLILVYGRSLCMPKLSPEGKQILSSLLLSPYFFLDVLYVHELPSELNLCKEVYDYFCDMDEEEEGYILEVSRSTTRLFDHMAALLAHPLQRPKQRDTFYKLTPREETESIV